MKLELDKRHNVVRASIPMIRTSHRDAAVDECRTADPKRTHPRDVAFVLCLQDRSSVNVYKVNQLNTCNERSNSRPSQYCIVLCSDHRLDTHMPLLRTRWQSAAERASQRLAAVFPTEAPTVTARD